jgi:transposase
MKKISKKIIREMVKLKRGGFKVNDICDRLEVSQRTVYNYTKECTSKKASRSAGRPRCLSKAEISFLVSQYKENKLQNLTDGVSLIQKKFKVTVTKQTVKNYLNKAKLKCFIKASKPLLTEAHKKIVFFLQKNFYHFLISIGSLSYGAMSANLHSSILIGKNTIGKIKQILLTRIILRRR